MKKISSIIIILTMILSLLVPTVSLAETAERAVGSSWSSIASVDFESNVDYVSVNSSGSGTRTSLSGLSASYPGCNIPDRGEYVYEFQAESNSARFDIDNAYENLKLTGLETGTIIKVSAWVFPADPQGTDPKLRFWMMDKKTNDNVDTESTSGDLQLKSNAWTKIGFTYAYGGGSVKLRIRSGASAGNYFGTVLIDDINVEVYRETGTIPADYSYTEDFDTFRRITSTYITEPKVKDAGSSSSGQTFSLYKGDKSGISAYSNNNAVALAGRGNKDSGIKINNIFQGIPNIEDVGKTYRISVMVYADKAAGVYSGNGNKTSFTADQINESTGTVFRLALFGPEEAKYTYRYSGYGAEIFFVPWNTWTKLELDYVVSENLLDNGSDADASNPLINAVRIDQNDADFSVNQGVADTFYIDDLSVAEIPPAPVSLASCFGDNMVIQRNAPIEVWGYSIEAGRKVTVTLGSQERATTTDEDGKWSVTFDAMDVQTDLSLTFAYAGENAASQTLTNIAVGDVILASGQSNMSLGYGRISNDVSDIEADTGTLKKVRVLTMTRAGSLEELADNSSFEWISADSQLRNNVTAIGLITAYNIAKEQNIPVGVIDASKGGAGIQTFMSAELLESRDMYDSYITKLESIKEEGEPSSWDDVPTGLYNSMLHPLRGLAISACVWYQGEGNRTTDEGDEYEYKQQDIVDMFRTYFKNESMPVAVCQLAPYSDGKYDEAIINIRQNQLNASRRQEGVYLIATCDVGPVNADEATTQLIHPSNKRPVAERCYLAIKHHNYGYEGEYTGPQYENMKVDGNTAVLSFSHADGLKIKANDGETAVTGFTISSDGTNFVDADAVIDGNVIKVSSASVQTPVEVRYCYVNWTYKDADGNIQSGSGFKSANYTLTGHLGGNVYNSIDLPLAPFKATVADLSIESTSVETKNNKFNCFVNVKNSGFSAITGDVLMALYSEGKLVAVKSVDAEFATVDNKDYSAEFDYITPASDTHIKVFAWDFPMLLPLCEDKSVSITQ